MRSSRTTPLPRRSSAGTVRIPTSTRRMTGGSAKMIGREDRREAARVEQHERRQQVHERGHRLGDVEERPQGVENRSLRAAMMPRPQPDREGDGRRDQDLDERLHRVLPQAHREDQQERDRGRHRLTTPRHEQCDPRDHPDRQPERRLREHGLDRVEDPEADDVLQAASQPRDVAAQPVDEGVDRCPERELDRVGERAGCREDADRRRPPPPSARWRPATRGAEVAGAEPAPASAGRGARCPSRSGDRGRWPGARSRSPRRTSPRHRCGSGRAACPGRGPARR